MLSSFGPPLDDYLWTDILRLSRDVIQVMEQCVSEERGFSPGAVSELVTCRNTLIVLSK